MAGISILRRLLLKEAVKGSGQASGIMSIGDSVRKLADKRLQSYLLSAQKQGVDLDKLGEQEIRYMLEMNKPKAPRVISQGDPEFKGITEALLGKQGKVIEGKFGKPFGETITDDIIRDINNMETIPSMKEMNKVIKRDGRYKNLTDKDVDKIFKATEDRTSGRLDDIDPEDMYADGGVAGLLGERQGFANGRRSYSVSQYSGGSKKSKSSGHSHPGIASTYKAPAPKSKSKSYSAPVGGGADMGTVSTPTQKANPVLVAAANEAQRKTDQINKTIAANRAAAQYALTPPKTKKSVLNYLDSIAKYAGPFVDPRKKPGQVLQLYKLFRDPLLGGMGNKIGYDQKNFNLGEDSSNIAYDERLGYIDLNTGQPINMAMPGATQVGVSDKQKQVIGGQMFGLKEGMFTPQNVYDKAKKFDDTGIFGIGADPMTKQEFNEYIKSQDYEGAGLELADGGRVPFAMGRRAFLKLLGVGGAGIAGLKTGVGLGGKKVATEVAKDVATTSATTPPPAYFFNLVNKIKNLGDDAVASQDKARAYKYKDYTMEEDFAGNIEIKKTNYGMFGDEIAPTEEVYMSYKVDEVPLKGRGKKKSTKVEEYEEYTARPDEDGKMKDVESGVPDDVIEDGTMFEDNMTDFGKADGGIARMLGE